MRKKIFAYLKDVMMKPVANCKYAIRKCARLAYHTTKIKHNNLLY